MPRNNHSSQTTHKSIWKRLPKWLRIVIYSCVSLLLLLVIFIGVVHWYINNNKSAILSKVSEQVQNHLNNGQLEIKDIDIALWKTFPYVSVVAKDISLTDSLYPQHHRKLAVIEHLYLKLDLMSIISRNHQPNGVLLEGGQIFMFKDSTGYSNTSVFSPKNNKESDPTSGQKIGKLNFTIRNVHFEFDNHYRNKKFDIGIHKMKGYIAIKEHSIDINTSLNLNVEQMAFNLDKGGFLTNTNVNGGIYAVYHTDKQQLEIPENKIKVANHTLYTTAFFSFDTTDRSYRLSIKGKKVNYETGKKLLNRHLQSKLKTLKIHKWVHADIDIQGYMRYADIPRIEIKYSFRNNKVGLPIGEMTQASVEGYFSNKHTDSLPQGDANTIVMVEKMSGLFEGIPIKLDSSYVTNLKAATLHCKVVANFPVEKLNKLAGTSFNFSNGTSDINAVYTGPLFKKDKIQRTLTGHLNITNAAVTYFPRSLKFKNCNARIAFEQQDVVFKSISFSSDSSKLTMWGKGSNFLSAIFKDNFKSSFTLNVHSPQVNLNEFKSFLFARKSNSTLQQQQKESFNTRLDNALAQSDMNLNIAIQKILYRKFIATHINANIGLLSNGIVVNNVDVRHAKGNINVKGRVDQNLPNNPFSLQSKISAVDVSELFDAFENFGLEALQSDNIKGRFSSDIAIKGNFEEDGSLKNKTLNGQVKFNLTQGELNNFEPFLQLQKFIFRNRELQHITFQDISDTFDIANGLVTIHPMEIISSAIYLKMQGQYAFDKGTDLLLEVPLRNPQKDAERIARGQKANRTKGLVIYLRAQDDANGKVKIKWDPRRKGWKEANISD